MRDKKTSNDVGQAKKAASIQVAYVPTRWEEVK